jgi:hypothetical protein
MTVIAHTIIRPHRGQSATAEDRVRQVSGIYARLGAAVKPSRIIAGPFAECIVLLRSYPDFRTASKIFAALNDDSEFAEFVKERDSNPVADVASGRNISRTVYGDNKWETHPITHLRTYEISRDKLAGALELFPEVQQIVSAADVNIVGMVPITGENLSTLAVSYQVKSVDHWGEVLDTVGTSDEFQAVIARAAEFGTLRTSGVMVPI